LRKIEEESDGLTIDRGTSRPAIHLDRASARTRDSAETRVRRVRALPVKYRRP
jgi:hypothetical protein